MALDVDGQLKANTHRRRDTSRQLSRVGVGGVCIRRFSVIRNTVKFLIRVSNTSQSQS